MVPGSQPAAACARQVQHAVDRCPTGKTARTSRLEGGLHRQHASALHRPWHSACLIARWGWSVAVRHASWRQAMRTWMRSCTALIALPSRPLSRTFQSNMHAGGGAPSLLHGPRTVLLQIRIEIQSVSTNALVVDRPPPCCNADTGCQQVILSGHSHELPC